MLKFKPTHGAYTLVYKRQSGQWYAFEPGGFASTPISHEAADTLRRFGAAVQYR